MSGTSNTREVAFQNKDSENVPRRVLWKRTTVEILSLHLHRCPKDYRLFVGTALCRIPSTFPEKGVRKLGLTLVDVTKSLD